MSFPTFFPTAAACHPPLAVLFMASRNSAAFTASENLRLRTSAVQLLSSPGLNRGELHASRLCCYGSLMPYDAHDIAALLREHPQFHRPVSVRGPRLAFRDATPDDAEFILSLRLDPKKNAHLSQVSPDIEAQRQWLGRYQSDPNQLYFIIEHQGRPVGTVRLYDQRGTSFCWGSWILSDDAPKSAALESTLMVYSVGLELGFTAAHFDVRKGNGKVWQYHERMGAERVGETENDYLYSITKGAVLSAIARYKERATVMVEWESALFGENPSTLAASNY